MDQGDNPTPDERERELAARGAALVAQAVGQVQAPQSLRERIEAQRSRSAPHRRRRHLAFAGGLAGALAIVLVALVFTLPSGTPGAPTVVEAAALSLRPALEPAPGENAANPKLLARAHEGVPYPYWEDKFKWRATGARVDHIGGRRATTVFYENPKGQRLGYTILSGSPIKPPADARAVTLAGTTLRHLPAGGRTIVTWERNGHTCVISAPDGVATGKLLALATWKGNGGVPF
jgi:hypothetical protein